MSGILDTLSTPFWEFHVVVPKEFEEKAIASFYSLLGVSVLFSGLLLGLLLLLLFLLPFGSFYVAVDVVEAPPRVVPFYSLLGVFLLPFGSFGSASPYRDSIIEIPFYSLLGVSHSCVYGL